MLYRKGFDHEACRRMSPKKWYISRPSKIIISICINQGGIRSKDIRLIKFLKYDTHIVLLISQLYDIVQRCFCTSDGAMELTFQMRYAPSCMFVDMPHPACLQVEKLRKHSDARLVRFFGTPFNYNIVETKQW